MDDEVWLIKLCLKPIRPWKHLIRGGFLGLSLSEFLLGTLAAPCPPLAALAFTTLSAVTVATVSQIQVCPSDHIETNNPNESSRTK